jgi:broad specificity phosphatase PhoE
MRIHLVRHASHSLLGRVLCGRSTDIGLDAAGHLQAEALARHFATSDVPHIALLQCSPRRRARETAEPIAASLGIALQIEPAIDEHDAGAWSGRSFEDLETDPRWRAWNTARGSNSPPGGESMGSLQLRIISHLETLAAENPLGAVVMVSHAEPVRAALMHYRGIPLDDFQRVEVAPAGIATLDISPTGVRAGKSEMAPA